MAIRLEVKEDIDIQLTAVIYDGEDQLIEVAIARNADDDGYQGWLRSPGDESSIHWRELPSPDEVDEAAPPADRQAELADPPVDGLRSAFG